MVRLSMRVGSVALFGRSNVGKSTFLNAAVGESLAIVSSRPQATRDNLLGVRHQPDAQIAFVDTPGLHRARNELGRTMNISAHDAAREADLLLVMTDLLPRLTKPWPLSALERDQEVLQSLPKERPSLLVINKIDLLRDKTQLLPLLEAYSAAHPFVEMIPVSVRKFDGVDRVLRSVVQHLPEAKPLFDEAVLTDRPVSYFVREAVREQVMEQTEAELPHAVAVVVERIEESKSLLRAQVAVIVEKNSQRRILIGRGGEQVKAIGTAARLRLETLLDTKVFLEIFVRESPRWKNTPRMLAELGYGLTRGTPEKEGT